MFLDEKQFKGNSSNLLKCEKPSLTLIDICQSTDTCQVTSLCVCADDVTSALTGA